MKGGQKAIEYRLGFRREAEPLNHWQQWSRWDWWDDGKSVAALDEMKYYNAQDLYGMRHIRRKLASTSKARRS
jgi:hypothetical protein